MGPQKELAEDVVVALFQKLWTWYTKPFSMVQLSASPVKSDMSREREYTAWLFEEYVVVKNPVWWGVGGWRGVGADWGVRIG